MRSQFMNLKFGICLIIFVCKISGQENTFDFGLDSMISAHMQEDQVPGICVAIIDQGKIHSKLAYGYANVKEKISMNTSHGFNVGSISKTFTAWAIMKLEEAGALELDDHISKHLKSWQLPKSSFDDRKVTIRNLLQHTAGLSVHGYHGYEHGEKLPTILECLDGKVRAKEKVILSMEPETKFQYSGGGYSILQLIIEEISEQSFEEFMKKEVFKPLGMKNTSFDITEKLLSRTSLAYDEEGQEIELRRFTAKAAAGLHTTIEDMTKFAFAHWEKNEVISSESIKKLTAGSKLSKEDYGMAYMIMERFGVFTLYGHGGSNDGWESGFMLDLKNKSGFIMLSNGSNGKKIIQKSLMTWAMKRRTEMQIGQ